MFYAYHQNNSGGSFDFDAARGISVVVIIEAPSARVADALAQDIGLYFGGEGDCSCCGDRWYPADMGYRGDNGDEEPRVYGDPVAEYEPHKWMPKGKPETFVHYADGRIEGYHSA